MTMTADWPQIDAAAVTSSSDLFGGDLFGDELMDMYNSAAVVDGSGATDAIESITEIPNLLPAANGEHHPMTTDGAHKVQHHTHHPHAHSTEHEHDPIMMHATEHPGAQVAMAAAAMDDGLGAFRPSTSFNDFGSLLPPEDEAEVKAEMGIKAMEAVANSVPVCAADMPTPIKVETGVAAAGAASGKPPAAKKRSRGISAASAAGTNGETCAVAPGAAPTVVAPAPKKRKPSAVASPRRRPSAAAASASGTVTATAAAAAAAVHPVSPTSAKILATAQACVKKGTSPSNKNANGKNTPNPLAIPNILSAGAGAAAAGSKVVTPKATVLGPAATTAKNAAAGVMAGGVGVRAHPAHVPVNTGLPAPKGAVATAAAAAAAAKAASASSTSAVPVQQQVQQQHHPAMMNPASVAAAAAAAAAKAKAAAAAVPASVPSTVVSVAPPAVAVVHQQARKEETTEDDFKGVAQAAVTNLIMTVGAKAGQNAAANKGKVSPAAAAAAAAAGLDANANKAVDTSSAHIAALTSSNWVAACSESLGDDAPPGSQQAAQAAALAAAAAASDPAASKAARARRANLTPDERARQNRDRNREHARNTRLRKKAYVEELKKTLTELVAQRDTAELEKRHEAQRDLEVREVRFRVMEEFLKLRSQGGNAGLLSRWVAIMEEGFTLTLPRTEYRSMVNQRNGLSRSVSIDHTSAAFATSTTEQVLKGASEAMEDASNLASFINTLGRASNVVGATTVPVRFAHHCDRKKFMMDGVNAMLEFTASSSGAIGRGAQAELFVKGTMRATFSPASNKLVCAELLFDTGSVASQAKTLATPPPAVAQLLPVPEATAATAAQVAASEADALLDSIQMPHLATGAAPVMPAVLSATSLDGAAPESSNVSVSSGDGSSDEGINKTAGEGNIATRRSARVQ